MLFYSSICFASPVSSSLSGAQNVKVGDRVTVTVTYTPSGSPVFTASSDLKYDASMLGYSGVSFGGTWLPINQAPYDLTESGHVVKTAGYPGGLSSSARFATFTFTALKAGTTNISLSGGMALDENNTDLGVQARTFPVTISGQQKEKAEVVEKAALKQQEVAPAPTITPTKQKPVETLTNKGENGNLGATITAQVSTNIPEHVPTIWRGNDININTENLEPGEYVVTVKDPLARPGNDVVIQKTILVTGEKKGEDSWIVKIFKFFGLMH